MTTEPTHLEALRAAATAGVNIGAFASPNPREFAMQALRPVGAVFSLPDVTARTLAAIDDPDTSPDRLQAIVAQDPALVARVLRVVNSAFYGRSAHVTSLERAIVPFGFESIRQLVIASSMGQLFRPVRLCVGFTARDLWTHSIAVAVACRELARHTELPMVEEAFLAGIVHDLGLLLELQLFPEQLSKACDSAGGAPVDF